MLAGGVTLGPGEPLAPSSPAEVSPRRFDYQPGRNLAPTPRAYEPITFNTLRSMCGSYDVARIAIEARKDEARGWEWDVRVKPIPGLKRDEQIARAQGFAEQVAAVRGFLLSPNQEDDFGTWLVQYLEDLFVIDAPTLYLRERRGGGLYAAEVVDGATIRVLIDDFGRLPSLGAGIPRPAPHVHDWRGEAGDLIGCVVCGWPAAYGQVIKGTTRTYFAAYEMIYEPYHQSATSPYGSPPMEWVLLSVSRALRRQTLDLSNFTEGTMPTAFYSVNAPEWTAGQLAELQEIIDTKLAGDDVARARVTLMPAGALQRINPEPASDVEKWLMTITAAAFGTSAFELGFEPNSGLGGAGFGESSRVSAEKRGSRPLAAHLKGILDRLIAGPLGAPELEFRFRGLTAAQDLLAEAQANEIRWKAGAYGTDEWRDDEGLDPVGMGPSVFDPKVGVVLVADMLRTASLTATTEADLQVAADKPPVSSATPGETTVGTTIEPIPAAKVSMSDDLAKWQRKALNAVRAGKDPARFASDAIDDGTFHKIAGELAGATTPAAVKAAFQGVA